MRRIIRYLSLGIMTALLTFLCTSCISQQQSTHACAYGEFSPSELRHTESGEEHDFIKMIKPGTPEVKNENGYVTQTAVEAGPWAKNYTADAPFVKAYCMTYDLTLKQSYTLGENVYVGICTHSASLDFDGGEVIVPKNSGFFVYDCGEHGCYAGMEVAKTLSKDYLEFAYYYNGQSTYYLPAGNYALNESFLLTDYLVSGKIGFENAANTSVCLNNFAQGLEGEEEISRLYDLGIQRIYRNCNEFESTHQKHICVYMQDEMNSIPLNQEKLDELLLEMKDVTVCAKNSLENYFFLHLTEDVSCVEALTIPQGVKVGVCRNGFRFDVPDAEGLYVFDCKEHVCVGDSLNVMTPIWKEGVQFISSYLADIQAINPAFVGEITLGDGDYALMDDFAANELPASIVFDENVRLCRNGHTIAENENAYAEGFTWDCRASSNEAVHACGRLPSNKPVVTIDYQTAEEVLTSGVLATKGEIVMVLGIDMQIPATLVIPQGTSLYLCLNGHSLVASQALHDSNFPYMFFVEFGASLTIVNCADSQSCGIFALTEEMLLAEEATYNESAAPIYNMGTCVVSDVALVGVYGVENAGHLIANRCAISGAFVGISSGTANYDEYPLYSKNPTVQLNDCEVVSLLCGVLTLGGDMEMNDSTVNSMLVGVVHTNKGILENESGETGTLTMNNVEIVMSMEMVEGYVEPEIAGSLKDMLEGGVVGVIATGNINLEGDLTMEVDSALLEPFVNSSGKLIVPQSIDFVLAQGKINVAGGVTLDQQYTVYCVMEEGGTTVVCNKDLSDNLLLMGGMASVLNNQNEMVVVAGNEALFMKNAVVYDASISIEGYLRLELYFEFDTVAEYLFIPNENSRVMVTVGGETDVVLPEELKTGGSYLYTIDLYAMDYAKKVNVQFTNGEYTWMGVADVSIESILTTIGAELDLQVEDVKSELAGGGLTEKQVAEAKEVLEQCYALKNAIVSMLNYCNLAATQFGTQDSYQESEESLVFIVENTQIDETTGESVVVKEELCFTVSQAMEYVSAEMLEAYKLKIAENAQLPEGVTFLGASLVLNSGLDIRFYFRLAEGRTLESLTFMVDGEETVPTAYKNSADTYYLAIDEISAFDIEYMFNIVIQDADMQAENSRSYSFEYGTLSYMYTALLDENSSQTLKDLAKATYIYAEMMQYAAEALMPVEAEDSSNDEVASEVL